MKTVSTIQDKMIEGSLDALDVNPNGIVIGIGLAEKFNLGLGRNLTVVAASGASRAMKVVGLFRTGNASADEDPNLHPAQARAGDVRAAKPGQSVPDPARRRLCRARRRPTYRGRHRRQVGLLGRGLGGHS